MKTAGELLVSSHIRIVTFSRSHTSAVLTKLTSSQPIKLCVPRLSYLSRQLHDRGSRLLPFLRSTSQRSESFLFRSSQSRPTLSSLPTAHSDYIHPLESLPNVPSIAASATIEKCHSRNVASHNFQFGSFASLSLRFPFAQASQIYINRKQRFGEMIYLRFRTICYTYTTSRPTWTAPESTVTNINRATGRVGDGRRARKGEQWQWK